jgi:ubiquinol-cytochrome c reductase iron-sulfur subunit
MMEPEGRKESGLFAILKQGLDSLKLGAESMKSLAQACVAIFPAKVATPPRPLPESGRAEDRDLESEAEFDRDERWGTLLVIFAFLVAVVGGIGFLFAFWWNRSNLLLGGSLALFLGGLGMALVFWSHLLMRQKQAVEPREVLPSPPRQRANTDEAFCAGVHEVRRRTMLKWMGGVSAALFAAMFLSLLRSLGVSPDSELFGTVWKRGQRLFTLDGKPVSLDSLQLGSTVTVFPEDSIGDENSQTVLIRVKEQSLDLPKDRADWAPGGYVAYSRICTHAGCPVGQYEAQRSILLCPCHQSTFDVLRAAAPTGGPAARPLPQLPLYADADGTLRAGGGFTAPPGPGFWEMP